MKRKKITITFLVVYTWIVTFLSQRESLTPEIASRVCEQNYQNISVNLWPVHAADLDRLGHMDRLCRTLNGCTVGYSVSQGSGKWDKCLECTHIIAYRIQVLPQRVWAISRRSVSDKCVVVGGGVSSQGFDVCLQADGWQVGRWSSEQTLRTVTTHIAVQCRRVCAIMTGRHACSWVDGAAPQRHACAQLIGDIKISVHLSNNNNRVMAVWWYATIYNVQYYIETERKLGYKTTSLHGPILVLCFILLCPAWPQSQSEHITDSSKKNYR